MKCRHFDGIDFKRACRAGVNYRGVRDDSRRFPDNFPCLGARADEITTCSERDYLTAEEEATERAEIIAAIDRATGLLADGRCPHCGSVMERRRAVGSCDYAEPCGHRLGTVR